MGLLFVVFGYRLYFFTQHRCVTPVRTAFCRAGTYTFSAKDNKQSSSKIFTKILSYAARATEKLICSKYVHRCRLKILLFVGFNISYNRKMVTQFLFNTRKLLNVKFIICKNIIDP